MVSAESVYRQLYIYFDYSYLNASVTFAVAFKKTI